MGLEETRKLIEGSMEGKAPVHSTKCAPGSAVAVSETDAPAPSQRLVAFGVIEPGPFTCNVTWTSWAKLALIARSPLTVSVSVVCVELTPADHLTKAAPVS